MITKLDQHSIILRKSWMKKHEMSYHEYDDSIFFHFQFCSHLRSLENSFSERTNKKLFFSKEKFSDQLELVDENKELLVFFEKTNSKTILKRSTSNQVVESTVRMVNESSKRLNKRRRINEFWRKKLSKIETSSSRILFRESRKNSFYDEKMNADTSKIDFIETNSLLKIHSIAAASFNTLSRQKDVKIFVVFMKDLDIQLKKQESKEVTDLKSIVLAEYHDFLNVFSKKKTDVLSSHRKHDHRIELKEDKTHEYAHCITCQKMSCYWSRNIFKNIWTKILSNHALHRTHLLFCLQRNLTKIFDFVWTIASWTRLSKKNRYLISLIAETIARLFKIRWMTKINIRHAFSRICMHSKEDKNLITFRTKYEIFKYLITSFELINDSFTFQNFINDTFMNYLDDFVMTYLDDIIVYNNIKKKHIQHVRKFCNVCARQTFKST